MIEVEILFIQHYFFALRESEQRQRSGAQHLPGVCACVHVGEVDKKEVNLRYCQTRRVHTLYLSTSNVV